MNNIEIVTSNDYKSCLIKNVDFSELVFLENPENEKKELYYEGNDETEIKHNQIIKDSYLFMKDEHAHFFLLLNPKTKTYDGTVFQIDSSFLIDLIGSNPFNFLTDEDKMSIQIYGIKTKELISNIKDKFGVQEFSLDYDNLDDTYDFM